MVSMIAVMAIVYAEHRRSFRSSSLLGAFLSITALFNTARARSYFIRPDLKPFGSIQAAIAVCKLTLVAMEEVSKQSLLLPERKSSSIGPEMQHGFWNRSLFIWINKTLTFGFKNVISTENLPSIGQEFATETLSAKFQTSWRNG